MLLFLFLTYISILIFFCIGTIRFTAPKLNFHNNTGISVIVAIRNGGESVKRLINDLKSQNYKGDMEFLLVDDKSTDSTKNIILNENQNDPRFKYVSSVNGDSILSAKKKALDAGIQYSNFNNLVFTDVDCCLADTWISTMSSYFSCGYDYVVGYSIVKPSNFFNIVTSFQRIDLLLLMSMCRASSFFGSPWASSGQNQGFTKILYNNVGGYKNIQSFIGDDTAFLQHCKKQGAKICFADDISARVFSRQEYRITDFLKQRIRWASDANQLWKINITFFMILFLTFIFYISLFSSILIIGVSSNIILSVIVIKVVTEYLLARLGANSFFVSNIACDFFIWQIFHIPYIILVSVLSYFPSFLKWKGRNISA